LTLPSAFSLLILATFVFLGLYLLGEGVRSRDPEAIGSNSMILFAEKLNHWIPVNGFGWNIKEIINSRCGSPSLSGNGSVS
jgi:hypothetical protein